jgi:hypothetical protein
MRSTRAVGWETIFTFKLKMLGAELSYPALSSGRPSFVIGSPFKTSRADGAEKLSGQMIRAAKRFSASLALLPAMNKRLQGSI